MSKNVFSNVSKKHRNKYFLSFSSSSNKKLSSKFTKIKKGNIDSIKTHWIRVYYRIWAILHVNAQIVAAIRASLKQNAALHNAALGVFNEDKLRCLDGWGGRGVLLC